MRISDWSSDVCSSDLIPFVLRDNLLARVAERDEHGVEVIDAQVDHILAVGGEIIGVGLERAEDHRACGDVTHPFVDRYRLVGALPGADTQPPAIRSEEHTSELQTHMRTSFAVFCLQTKNMNSLK